MSSPPHVSRPHRFPYAWDAWILIALGILGIVILAVRRGSFDRVGEKTDIPAPSNVPTETVPPESNPVESAISESKPLEIAPSSVVPNDAPRASPVSAFRERMTANEDISPMDSLIAASNRNGSSFLPSGVMVTLSDPDAMIWIPLESSAVAPDSSVSSPPPWLYPQERLVSVTDCTRLPPPSVRDSIR